MRGYSVATAALALKVEPKWLDNLLSQNRVPGVAQAGQGVQRRIQPEAIYLIATAHALNRDFQIPVGAALRLAQALWAKPGDREPEAPSGIVQGDLAVSVNRAELRQRMATALAEALEIAPRPRRGRPPKRRR